MIELIPAIDIIDGKCVRLSQGNYNSKKVYNENPLEVAKEFEAYGIRRLHMVDLDGAASHPYRELPHIGTDCHSYLAHHRFRRRESRHRAISKSHSRAVPKWSHWAV